MRADNAKGEYYLTDTVALARAEGGPVVAVEAPAEELAGVNSRAELAAAEAVLQGWLRRAAMEAGVTLTDPGSVFLSHDTELAADVTIGPNVVFGPGVRVAPGREDPRLQPSGGLHDRPALRRRTVRPAAARRGAGQRGACRQLRRDEVGRGWGPGRRPTT